MVVDEVRVDQGVVVVSVLGVVLREELRRRHLGVRVRSAWRERC